ncbi:MAG TPA: RimK family alpha-L-glutamate ligase [Armatimonadota bacterium]|nr:RimK family alpha-L-glutamate ligase [Armatimonadota bacterium]
MGEALRIGIVTAYLEQDWHSQQLVAAVARIAEPCIIRPDQLGAAVMPDGVSVLAQGIDLTALDGFILARGFGDRGNSDFLVPVYQMLERTGAVLVNSINALLVAIDKFETSVRLRQAGVATPKVVVAQDVELARGVLREWGRAVVKPLFGSLGLGIELVEDTPGGYALLPVLLERFGAIYLQEFVPTPGRDIRAFVVGDRVAASIYRVAAPGGWRTNIAQGGAPERCRLDAATAGLAVAAARAVGLDYTGVDLLEGPEGPSVIEVNGNPLWQGVLDATGRNMAEEIVAWVITRITQTAAKGGEGRA